MDPVMDAYRAGRISTPEMRMLRGEVEQMRDGTTNSFQKQVQQAREVVYTSLTRSIIGQSQPDVAADAAYRFTTDLNNAIDAKRKANEDPRSLLDPKSRDYMLKPESIQSYLPSAPVALAAGAARWPSKPSRPFRPIRNSPR